MTPFDEGWVPRGWTRGEKLRHTYAQNSPGHFTGSIEPLVEIAVPGQIKADYIIFIHYDWSEREKVAKWLEWWHG